MIKIYGLTFNGKHSFQDFGLVMFSKDRPLLPEPKIITEDAPGIDGELDYSSVNPDGETKYKDRPLEIEFTLKEPDPRYLRIKAREIAAWLACGEKQLVFDDEPDKFWLARVANRLDLENQIVSLKRFTIQFKCRPFAYWGQTTDNLILDSDILLDSDIRLDEEYSFSITGVTTVEVNNVGTRDTKPVIEVTGQFTTLAITVNGKTMTYNEALSSGTLRVDCEHMQVAIGSTNKTNAVNDFIKIPVGINEVQIGGTGLNCTVSFIFRPQFY